MKDMKATITEREKKKVNFYHNTFSQSLKSKLQTEVEDNSVFA